MARSVILLLAQIGILGGLIVGNQLSAQAATQSAWQHLLWWWLTIGLACLVLAKMWPDRSVQIVAVVAGCLVFGFGWSVIYRNYVTPRELPFGQEIELDGLVVDYPVASQQSQKLLVRVNFDRPTYVQVRANREPAIPRGSHIRIRGKLEQPEPFDGFDYPRYLEGQGIYGLVSFPETVEVVAVPQIAWQRVNTFRNGLLTTMYQSLPEPVASLAAGLSLGLRPTIDEQFYAELRITNLTHLAAVSGANLGLTVLLYFLVARRWWLRGAIVTSVGLLVGYVLLVGSEASILRAALMLVAYLSALVLGRPSEPLRILVFAATLIGLVQPLSITHDLGLHLSFAAFAGIILLGPMVENRLGFVPSELRLILGALVGATIAVLPVQLATFGTISLVGPLANLIVAPIVPVAMAAAMALGLLGYLVPILSLPLAWLAYLPLEFIHIATHYFALLPSAQITLALTVLQSRLLIMVEILCLGAIAWQHARFPLASKRIPK